ncbi:MAG: glycosyltransferase, partial [Candidatus Brocadiaceae bacterium]
FARRGYAAHYVPHGVQWHLFRTAVDRCLPEPEDLKSIPEPRLGFYGFLSDEWVDYGLLRRMAVERPDWHIVLIGRPKAGMDMDSHAPEPNIHWLGLKPFEELPAYTRHFQVGLVPFCVNSLTRHSNPLKLLEYLSGGLPVVTTDIPEVHTYEGLVHIASSREEFIAACEEALSEGDPAGRDVRSRATQQHSWEARVARVASVIYGGRNTAPAYTNVAGRVIEPAQWSSVIE